MSEGEGRDDPRLRSAWRTWLSALAVDAEAAVAASLAYEALGGDGRDAWLDALSEDAPSLEVPALALYAPLLGVETDEARRARILGRLGASGGAAPRREVRALLGVAEGGDRIGVLVSPLYLDFVALLVCRYRADGGILSARRDPMRHALDLACGPADEPGLACDVDGVAVFEAELSVVIEELAHAIVADQRAGRAPPGVLGTYAHLFGPKLADAAPHARP